MFALTRSERGLDEVGVVRAAGAPLAAAGLAAGPRRRSPAGGARALGPRRRDVLTVRLLKNPQPQKRHTLYYNFVTRVYESV